MTEIKIKKCVCGDSEYEHVDGMGLCLISECGCTEFEEVEETQPDEAHDEALSDAEGRN